MNVVELSRRIENMIRLGTVAEVDHTVRRVRVESGELITGWLKWRVARAGQTRTWNPPTVGEQVMILSPSGELANGIVMPSIYCDEFDAPSESADEHVTTYPDGARIAYNHVTGALSATGIKTGHIEASVSVTLDTPMTHCTGDLHVEGCATVDDLLTYQNGLAGSGGGHGNTITGDINHSAGNLISNGVTLHTHVHTGVQTGSGNTGGPQ